MNDAATGTMAGTGSGGFAAFPAEAVRHLLDGRMIVPALAALVVLTGSNIVILLNLPPAGTAPAWQFLAAAFVRLAGILVLAVAILRIAAPGERSPWRPDGAFWLYALAVVASFGFSAIIGLVVGDGGEASGVVTRIILGAVVLAPFAPWMVGIAVATPLGWNPARFMRDFGRWLPALTVWTLILVTPLAILHALIDLRLVAGVGQSFWPLALFDGALSTVMAIIALGLNAEAYRRVAQD